MSRRLDLVGKIFGKLTVVAFDGIVNEETSWRCKCDCGKDSIVGASTLRTGHTKSCGCSNGLHDITGKRFGRLQVISSAGQVNKVHYWNCLCDCGNETKVIGKNLKSGGTKSCGCYAKELWPIMNKTHGQAGQKDSTEYKCWAAMKVRCLSPENKKYKDYGGRGITVCDEWLNSFEQFYKDMGSKPSSKHSLDRIENNKGYSKENCRWATREEQSNNTRYNVFIPYEGKSLSISQWSRYLGIPINTIHGRFNKGFNLNDVFYKGRLKPTRKDQLSSLRLEIETLKAK